MNALARQGTTAFTSIQQGAPRHLSINPKAERLTTVLASTTTLEGNLRFEEGVKIDGVVKGDITFGIDDGLCIISKSAQVEGNLRGPKALILGEVQGNVEISGTLVLAATAVIVGSVKCGRLVVRDGASVTGSIETVRAPVKQIEQIVDVPTATADRVTRTPVPEESLAWFRRPIFGWRKNLSGGEA